MKIYINQQEVMVKLTPFRLARLRSCLEDRIEFLRLMLTRAEGLKAQAIRKDIAMTSEDLKSLIGPIIP